MTLTVDAPVASLERPDFPAEPDPDEAPQIPAAPVLSETETINVEVPS